MSKDFYLVAESSAGGIFGEPRDERPFHERVRVVESAADPRLIDRVRTADQVRAIESTAALDEARTGRLVEHALQSLFSAGERRRIDELQPDERQALMNELSQAVVDRDPGEPDRLRQLRDTMRERLVEKDRSARTSREMTSTGLTKW